MLVGFRTKTKGGSPKKEMSTRGRWSMEETRPHNGETGDEVVAVM